MISASRNYCIPMSRNKLRRLLARELCLADVAEKYSIAYRATDKMELEPLVDFAVVVYLDKYYPGKYQPYMGKDTE